MNKSELIAVIAEKSGMAKKDADKALAAVISLISMPCIIGFCKKFSLYDYQNTRKIHSGNIPRLGGVGIVSAFFISTILFIYFTKDIALSKHLPILIAGLIIFVIFFFIFFVMVFNYLVFFE